jgi:hypothetical protein
MVLQAIEGGVGIPVLAFEEGNETGRRADIAFNAAAH